MTWTELVMGAADEHDGDPTITDVRTGQILTRTAFARRVTHVAGGLRSHGLRYGDRVQIDLPLGIELATAVHAVVWAGGVAVLHTRGPARMLITQRVHGPIRTDVERVFTVEPSPGAQQFTELMGERAVDFGPLSGPALVLYGGRTLELEELTEDLRQIDEDLLLEEEDVVLAAVSDTFRGLRAFDIAMMAASSVVIAHEPSLVGCRVLIEEHEVTLVVAAPELARRLAGDPDLRVLDERAIVRALAL
ncbi:MULTISPECIES: AMP-binding protein [unclassified Nonomuraea]|uniref:AMP-binding protein n=1 Tax=unclassified Nonomuraea TaxID=2593643 RepID=UPI003403908D